MINYYFWGFLSIAPWAFAVLASYPEHERKQNVTKILLVVFFSLVLGYVATEIILILHPILWKTTDVSFRKPTSMLTQTAHAAFIEAGLMEETFKAILIITLGMLISFDRKTKKFDHSIVVVAAFIALGFSVIENSMYISKETDLKRKIDMFMGRTFHSSIIHLLINILFGLFLFKTNSLKGNDKLKLGFAAYLLAILQHGLADFFLIPGSIFGSFVNSAFFAGIWVLVARMWRDAMNTSVPRQQSPVITA